MKTRPSFTALAVTAAFVMFRTVSAANLPADVLFQEDFENPDVPSYSQGITPDIWVRAAQGYGSGDHGMTDKSGGDFSAPPGNEQAYAFRYSNSGITTKEKALGSPLAFGGGYEVSFDVVKDNATSDIGYNVKLIAFGAGAVRNDCRSIPSGSTQLATATGNAPSDGSIATVTFTFIPDATTHAAEFGKDLGIRVIGSLSSSIVDNIRFRAIPGAGSGLNLVTTSPLDNSVNNLASSPVKAIFSRNIAAGSGNITLRNLTDSIDTVIPVGDPRISINGCCLDILPGPHLDWAKDYAVLIGSGALIESPGGTPFTGISDPSVWNFTMAGGDPLFFSISRLKSHILGNITLTAGEIDTIKKNLDTVAGRFAESSASITALLDLISTYDTGTIAGRKGPLWVATGLPKRDVVTNDLHWTMFNVMQNVMDRIYTGQTLADHESLLNGFKLASSANFPGNCTTPSPTNVHTATISASYLDTYGPSTIQDGPGTYARKPTGCYLAPGTIATVTVPASMVNTGYKIRVGCHSWDYSAKPDIKRLDRVTRVYDIKALQTKVANPLGGGIYIEVPFLANAGVVTVDVTGAARSPYFSAKSFHATTTTEWETIERNNPGPWADFQTDKFMMQVPKSWIYSMTGAQAATLMSDWDKAMDAINDLMGYTTFNPATGPDKYIFGKETMYPQVDLLLKNSVYAPGYPSVNTTYSPTGNYNNGYASSHLVRGPQNAPDYEFHEQGHGYLFPKFAGETESAVNLLHVAVWNRKFGKGMDEAFRKSRGYTRTYMTLDTTAIAWMCVFNFSPREAPMDSAEKAYQLKGHAKFVDIAYLYGWDVLGKFWGYMVDMDHTNTPYATDTDTMLLRLCKAVGKDIRPLLHFWGIHPQNPSALAAAIAAAVPPLPPDPAIKARLLYYKSLVPANNAAFRTFAQGWWGKQPSINGYWEEREHSRQWDQAALFGTGDQQRIGITINEEYIEACATQVQDRVQELVDLYFPSAISPNPMSFAIAPTAQNPNTIGMVANIATAAIGPIEYLFEETSGNPSGDDSGWQTSPSYEDTGLTPGLTYSYTVTARDGLGNLTDPSAVQSATAAVDGDVTPPSPVPMTFANPPAALGESSITMTAATVTDINGVQYYFQCTGGGGPDSGWQSSPEYTVTGLPPGTEYSYVVRARDSVGNTTADSDPASATTTAPDEVPPTILTLSPSDNSTNVPVTVNLVATFDEPIGPNSGSITIKNLTDGPAGDITINVTDGSQVVISGAGLAINPAADLQEGKTYAVQISVSALQDIAGNPFAGISDDVTWSFSTPAPLPPGAVFADNFEPGTTGAIGVGGGGTTPDVAAYTVTNTSQQANTTLWVRANQGFGGSTNGLVDESENSGGNFTDPTGSQAYAFRYTNSGVTSAAGKIGALTAGTSYTVSFDVVKDGWNGGLPYTAQLIALAPGAARNDCRSTPAGSLVLKQVTGNATSDGAYKTVSFTYTTGDIADAAHLGYDLGLRFVGATSKANIDNVSVSITGPGGPGPADHFAISPISSPQTVGTPITGIMITAQDASNNTATGFTGTVTFGGTGGFSGTSANFTDGVLSGVSVTPTVAGSDLTLTADDGADHTGSITIATIQSIYDAWSGGAAASTDSNGDGVGNGVAWALGATGPAQNAIGLLPTSSNTDPSHFIFTYNRSDVAHANAAIAVEYGSDLGGWTTAVHDGDNVIINVTDGSPTDAVQVKLKRSTLGSGGTLFARLKVAVTP